MKCNKRITKNNYWLLVACLVSFLLILCTILLRHKELGKDMLIVRGDLHCHSNFSHDSNVSVEQVIEESIKTGYDFIALTEHNTIEQLKKDFSTEKLIVLPGYELTLKTGHINLYGVRSFEQKTDISDAEEITEFLDYFHGLGGIVQINHPNDAPKYNAKFGYNIPMDMIEVWNNGHSVGPKFDLADQKTLEDWHEMLCHGRKIVATGGSDKHANHLNRSPFNCVIVKEKTAESILENIGKGHMYITATLNGPIIELFCGSAIIGDTVKYSTKKKISMRIRNIVSGTTVKVYSNKGLEMEKKMESLQNQTYEKEFPMEGRIFYRVEVWGNPGFISAISNPIYIEKQPV